MRESKPDEKLIQLDKIRGPFEFGIVAGRIWKRRGQLKDDLSCGRRGDLRSILFHRANELQRCSDILTNTHVDKQAKVVADMMNEFRYTV